MLHEWGSYGTHMIWVILHTWKNDLTWTATICTSLGTHTHVNETGHTYACVTIHTPNKWIIAPTQLANSITPNNNLIIIKRKACDSANRSHDADAKQRSETRTQANSAVLCKRSNLVQFSLKLIHGRFTQRSRIAQQMICCHFLARSSFLINLHCLWDDVYTFVTPFRDQHARAPTESGAMIRQKCIATSVPSMCAWECRVCVVLCDVWGRWCVYEKMIRKGRLHYVSRQGKRRWGGRENNRGRGRERETERDEREGVREKKSRRQREGEEEQETERRARER